MSEKRWQVSNTAVYNINYHLIWTTKYRLKLLVGDVKSRMKTVLFEKAAQIGVVIEALEIMPDHVHLFVSAKPNLAPQYIIQQLKGVTSRRLRVEFPTIKSRTPSLWTRSYYCESVGHISTDTITQYIQNQKGRNE